MTLTGTLREAHERVYASRTLREAATRLHGGDPQDRAGSQMTTPTS